jgi:hypothetical protein
MKIYHYLVVLLTCLIITVATKAQNQSGVDSTGLPGDNFSLQGALAMFQKAGSPEEFEKLLNAQDNHVNNLDLNGDGQIDYIRVIDNAEKGAHALVLRDAISETESQDIAVIDLEKTGDTTAVLQIIGDEDIYGEKVIVEPGDGDEGDAFINNEFDNKVYHGPDAEHYTSDYRVVFNVWFWPSVRFMYAPIYNPWISPWRWGYYPAWWRPWRPFAWHIWHPFHRPYYAHCAVVHTVRVVRAQRFYTPLRVTSVTVGTRHAAAVGNYRVTRTRAVGPRGNVRTRTTVTGPRGNPRTKTRMHRR